MPTQPDCLFCRISSGALPVEPVWQDDRALGFRDIHPQAPTHLLVIPRDHYADVTEVPAELLGHLMHAAAALARRTLPDGHRLVLNTGRDGGQTVAHVHCHVLGGRALGWPPG